MAKLDLPLKRQPELLINQKTELVGSILMFNGIGILIFIHIHPFIFMIALSPNVCTIKCYACKLEAKCMFCLSSVILLLFLMHYSIKLVNKKNRVVTCILQSCDHKNTHNLALDVVSIEQLYKRFFSYTHNKLTYFELAEFL